MARQKRSGLIMSANMANGTRRCCQLRATHMASVKFWRQCTCLFFRFFPLFIFGLLVYNYCCCIFSYNFYLYICTTILFIFRLFQLTGKTFIKALHAHLTNRDKRLLQVWKDRTAVYTSIFPSSLAFSKFMIVLL